MEIPINISSIISRINQSEDNWKAIFMAIWQHSDVIRNTYEKTDKWNKKIIFRLPASKNNSSHSYTPYQLHSILTSRDGEFTIGHLQTLFSLFEGLVNESSKILCSEEIDASKWQDIEKKFFDENNDLISEQELKELKLAKEIRNCYLHNNGQIDQKWLNAYAEAKENPTSAIGNGLEQGFPNSFHQIEKWNELVVIISDRIKTKIENK